LTANQQIVFSKDESRMIRSLVENPAVLPAQSEKKNFEFTNTPIKEVFSMLEDAYGVQIIYDEQVMANCYLNASLDDVPFYDKLKFICKGVNAKYEILDAHIIISGGGCN